MKVAICISCGCDDNHACDDGLCGGCGWLKVDRAKGVGVCSSCPGALKHWNAPSPGWQVHRHGGGNRHGWRRAFVGNWKPARNQEFLLRTMIQQGGVRLVSPCGVIVASWWRRHAPGAKPVRIDKDIGRKARLG